MPERDNKGRFARGNSISRAGWQGQVDSCFEGKADWQKEWIGKKGAYAYDTPYRNRGLGVFKDPGSPAEFVARKKAHLENLRQVAEEITLESVNELAF